MTLLLVWGRRCDAPNRVNRWRIQTAANAGPITSSTATYQKQVGNNPGGINGYAGEEQPHGWFQYLQLLLWIAGTADNETYTMCCRRLLLCQAAK